MESIHHYSYNTRAVDIVLCVVRAAHAVKSCRAPAVTRCNAAQGHTLFLEGVGFRV
jgi:hypothetical protein